MLVFLFVCFFARTLKLFLMLQHDTSVSSEPSLLLSHSQLLAGIQSQAGHGVYLRNNSM